MAKDSRFIFWVTVFSIVGALAYSGMFYQTGKQWYDTCWSAKNSKDGPKTPDEAAAWGKCNYVATKAIFDAGIIFVGNRDEFITDKYKKVASACPSSYSDIPISGVDTLAIDLITEHGGANWADKFLPSDYIIERAFTKRWPNCIATRSTANFPKMELTPNGFGWAAECAPCKAEESARSEISTRVAQSDLLNPSESSFDRLIRHAELESDLRKTWGATHEQ